MDPDFTCKLRPELIHRILSWSRRTEAIFAKLEFSIPLKSWQIEKFQNFVISKRSKTTEKVFLLLVLAGRDLSCIESEPFRPKCEVRILC
jgi:hypothetical protein